MDSPPVSIFAEINGGRAHIYFALNFDKDRKNYKRLLLAVSFKFELSPDYSLLFGDVRHFQGIFLPFLDRFQLIFESCLQDQFLLPLFQTPGPLLQQRLIFDSAHHLHIPLY